MTRPPGWQPVRGPQEHRFPQLNAIGPYSSKLPRRKTGAAEAGAGPFSATSSRWLKTAPRASEEARGAGLRGLLAGVRALLAGVRALLAGVRALLAGLRG